MEDDLLKVCLGHFRRNEIGVVEVQHIDQLLHVPRGQGICPKRFCEVVNGVSDEFGFHTPQHTPPVDCICETDHIVQNGNNCPKASAECRNETHILSLMRSLEVDSRT